jgi:hypothetical protein
LPVQLGALAEHGKSPARNLADLLAGLTTNPFDVVSATATTQLAAHDASIGHTPGPYAPQVAPHQSRQLIDLSVGRHWFRGRALEATGEPLGGAVVTLVRANGEEVARAVSGVDGSYALAEIAEGTYTLVATAPDHRASASIVYVPTGNTGDGAITLLGLGSVTGAVVRAKDGSPLEARLELSNPNGGVAVQCLSAADGTFAIPDILEGDYDLAAELSGYRREVVRLGVQRGSTQAANLRLVGLGHLYGAVSSPRGGWLPGVAVTLVDLSGDAVAATSTDGAGSYHFPSVPEGPYTVRVPASGAAAIARVDVSVGATVAVDLLLAAD